MSKVSAFLVRLGKDESGIETVEIALAIALFALVAAGGYFIFGTALANFFTLLGSGFEGITLPTPLQTSGGSTGGSTTGG